MPSRFQASVVPGAFVLIWSTGFVVARLVAPYAEPLTFLTVRFMIAGLVLTAAAALARARWPTGWRGWRDAAIAGMLLHGLYLGGVFWAVRHGLPAGISALIAGAQPLLVALLARPFLGEHVSGRRWLGVWTGFAGIALVLLPRLTGAGAFPLSTLLMSFLSLLGITAGTIWQKRTGAQADLRSGTAVQFAGATAIVLPLALLTETLHLEPVPALWIGLAWSSLGMSVGAIALLLVLIRRGAVVAVSSLMFLVPPVSALMSYGLFGETLSAVQLFGMGLAALGVALAARA